MKSHQKLVEPMTNICKMFLALLWKMKTISKLFYDFDKIAMQWDMLIFNF